MQLATYVTVSCLGYFLWLNGNILHNEHKCRAPILTCDKYKSSLRHIHDPVLSSLKMKGIRLLFCLITSAFPCQYHSAIAPTQLLHTLTLDFIAFYRVAKQSTVLCVTSDLRRDVTEHCALLGSYAASSGNFLSTFRDNLSVPSSGFLLFIFWIH
jgi:hypothetical protein